MSAATPAAVRVARATVVWAVMASVAVSGCGPETAPDRPELGRLAPAYSAPTLSGDTVSLESLRGEVVLLNFWATWCIPCRTETPFLQSLHDTYAARGLRVVGASMDQRAAVEDIRAFAERYGVEYTLLHDPATRGLDVYRVVALPGNFLIDREGRVRWMAYGALDEGDEAFSRALTDALGGR
jgi:cytochrome c-type biogenesis protein